MKSTSTITILQIEINGSLLLKFQSSALKISQKAIEMTSNAVEIPHRCNSSIDIGFLVMSAHFASFPLKFHIVSDQKLDIGRPWNKTTIHHPYKDINLHADIHIHTSHWVSNLGHLIGNQQLTLVLSSGLHHHSLIIHFSKTECSLGLHM